MKIAYVTPIFKSGDEYLLTNYRPISVLPRFSKILKCIASNRVYNFLIENKILNVKQFVFHKQTDRSNIPLKLPDLKFNNISLKRETELKFVEPWTRHIGTFEYFLNFFLSANFNVVPG